MGILQVIWDFVSKPEHLGAALAILGGLKVFSRYTKNTIDDKVLTVLEWPFKKLLGSFPK